MVGEMLPVDGGQAEGPELVDFYEVLSLGRDDSVEQLQSKLEKLRIGYLARASKAGRIGGEARATVRVDDGRARGVSRPGFSGRDDFSLFRAKKSG